MGIGSISGYFDQTNALVSRTSPPPPPPGRGGQGLTFSEVLSKMDADGSGTLSADELNISEEAFALADSDGDGVVTQEEFEAGGAQAIGDYLRSQESQPAGTAGQGPSFDELLARLDADGNGTLNVDELDVSSEVFAEADTDGDGEVSREEFENGGAQAIGDYLRSQEPSSPPGGAAPVETAGASSDSGGSTSGAQAGASDFLNRIAAYLNNMQQFDSRSENSSPVNAIGRGLHRIA
jgi:Ca2+-binding EF-hand superfamily protein